MERRIKQQLPNELFCEIDKRVSSNLFYAAKTTNIPGSNKQFV